MPSVEKLNERWSESLETAAVSPHHTDAAAPPRVFIPTSVSPPPRTSCSSGLLVLLLLLQQKRLKLVSLVTQSPAAHLLRCAQRPGLLLKAKKMGWKRVLVLNLVAAPRLRSGIRMSGWGIWAPPAETEKDDDDAAAAAEAETFPVAQQSRDFL